MKATTYITGHEKVIALFGDWPTFHDAEVLSLSLERAFPVQTGVSLVRIKVVVRRYEAAHVGTAEFHMAMKCGAIVTFVFHGVSDAELEGFNYQNVINSLQVSPSEDEKKRLKVEIESIWGLGGIFLCDRAEVENVEELLRDEA